MINNKMKAIFIFIVIVAIILPGIKCSAATLTSNDTGGGNWTDPNSWDGSNTPDDMSAGDTLVILAKCAAPLTMLSLHCSKYKKIISYPVFQTLKVSKTLRIRTLSHRMEENGFIIFFHSVKVSAAGLTSLAKYQPSA